MDSLNVISRKRGHSLDVGDSREWVKTLPDSSIHCVVTSPPYYGLRSYLPEGHADKNKEIGLEKTSEEYVVELVGVFRELRRTLHPSGVLWLNLGDSYAGGGGFCATAPSTKTSKSGKYGLLGALHTKGVRPQGDVKSKDLIGIPWMVAFALRADGWYLRQACPWVKRNSMPDSADDRPGVSCETVFLLSKTPDYYFDMEAVKRTSRTEWNTQGFVPNSDKDRASGGKTSATGASRANRSPDLLQERNWRNGDLWFDSVGMLLSGDGMILGFDVNPQPDKSSHFALMPKKLIRPMILSGSSECGVCPHCGNPWERVVEKNRRETRPGNDTKVTGNVMMEGNRDPKRHITATISVGWSPTCKCKNNVPVPAVVCDPFSGLGTVLRVAKELKRSAVGCELNVDYAAQGRRRLVSQDENLF